MRILILLSVFLSGCIMSDKFHYDEFVRSDTALRLNIDNVPNDDQIVNGKALYANIIQPIREEYDIRITSAFRNVELNHKVGGVKDSQHINGEAVDIVVDNKEEVAQWIIDNLEFDQLIIEPSWLHISYSRTNNRKEVLRISPK